MTQVFNEKEVHLYDPETGEYVKSYPSGRQLEREQGAYRGMVSEIIKGKIKSPKILVSYVKYDFFPGFTGEPKKLVPFKPETLPCLPTLSEADLRKKHDMFFQIQSFVVEIPAGKYIEEPALLRHLGLVGKPRYKDALSRPELKPFRGKVDGVTYYGSSESIKKLKSEGILL